MTIDRTQLSLEPGMERPVYDIPESHKRTS